MTQLQQLGEFLGRKFKDQQADLSTLKVDFNAAITKMEAGVASQISAVRSEMDQRETVLKAADFAILGQAKTYTDTAIANLIGGAPTTLDTLKEIADAVEENQDVLAAIQEVANNHTHANATQVAPGFMSAQDKIVLDNIGTYEQLVASFNAVVGAGSSLYEASETDPGAGSVGI